ncbi:hypothetical protein [Sigmofec virus UA08Rod_4577]|uniref:Uncharacterized protein n=1 Tax=Sigmofec virus UA08Rod_4577 TaxID=2929404 RepID=A0A976N1F7_9VIRU|nr:hypothetical protein [Sigmofec virus UA08Rod_4577]
MKHRSNPDNPANRGRVIPNLGVDINKLIETNTVPDTHAEVIYNELSEIESVGIRVNDNFKAMALTQGYKKLGLHFNKTKDKDK